MRMEQDEQRKADSCMTDCKSDLLLVDTREVDRQPDGESREMVGKVSTDQAQR